ncbi:MAG: V-type ATPase 116kDa subunit family protein [Clostridia bacterium]|nr:V-type ATPase 116kDa subunit family protein [Clostridia bacterium]
MAIEKMRLVSIMGALDDFDRVVESYVKKVDIHLENALSELRDSSSLSPIPDTFPYQEALSRAADLFAHLEDSRTDITFTAQEAVEKVKELDERAKKIETRRAKIALEAEKKRALTERIGPMCSLNVDIDALKNCEYTKVRFGRMPRDNYDKLSTYINEDMCVIYVPTEINASFVWLIYFTPTSMVGGVDVMFRSLDFESVSYDDLSGMSRVAYGELCEQCDKLEREMHELEEEEKNFALTHKDVIAAAYTALTSLADCYEIRKYAAITKRKFFVIVGWMTPQGVRKLELLMHGDKKVMHIVEDSASAVIAKPPVKLKNPRLLRPFEMFVKMYGMPSYNEFDPTPLVAVTYSVFFGMMFGDLGQGALLAILGLLIYKVKHIRLAAIISAAGVCSCFFGVMYGSCFGLENLSWLPARWLRPLESSMDIMMTTVGIGIGVIVLCMVINIINAIKQRRIADALLGTSGGAGLLFYLTLVLTLLGVLTGTSTLPAVAAELILLLALILMGAREPIAAAIHRQKPVLRESVGMYMTQTFFELFEVVLSYVTNSVSFVRVGAFALSHAGMMSVVLMLSAKASGVGSIAGLIFGNLFVMCLEGLIVGIQVLRLEFYELFSRFYRGGGREFRPYKSKNV